TDPRRKREITRDDKKAGRDTPIGLCSILKHNRTRLKVRHAFVMMLCAILLMSLSAGCAKVAEPSRESTTHILQNGFRNTNTAFAWPSLWERLTFLSSRTWTTTIHPRTAHLPRVENDGTVLKNDRSDATVTWVGHSTLLIQLDGVTILTDPQWSERASPVTFAGPKRLMPPGVSFDQLPTVDLVV